jgi:nucleoside-diphosphate-sugar epimerase
MIKAPYSDIRDMNLITGITGLLGTHIALELLSRGEKVRGLIRENSSTDTLQRVFAYYGSSDLFSRIEWITGDVLDVTSLVEATEGCTAVFHCAAVVSYHRLDRKAMYKINVEGTINVVNAAIHHGNVRLVHISSTAAIGRTLHDQELDENSEWKEGKNTTHYAITKHLSEIEVWRGIQEGLNAVIINSGFIIGPGDFGRSSAAMFQRIYRGVPFYPPGGTGFISASDVARVSVELLAKEQFGERFIAVAENRSMKEVFSLVAAALGKPVPTKEVTMPMLWTALIGEQLREWLTGKKALVTREIIRNMQGTHTFNNEKLKRITGERFQSVEDAVKRSAQLFLELVRKN